MASRINTEGLKSVSNMHIEAQKACVLGKEVFYDIGTLSPDYIDGCMELRKSCELIVQDAERIMLMIPNPNANNHNR